MNVGSITLTHLGLIPSRSPPRFQPSLQHSAKLFGHRDLTAQPNLTQPKNPVINLSPGQDSSRGQESRRIAHGGKTDPARLARRLLRPAGRVAVGSAVGADQLHQAARHDPPRGRRRRGARRRPLPAQGQHGQETERRR